MTWDRSAVEGALEDRQDLPRFLALCPVIEIYRKANSGELALDTPFTDREINGILGFS